MCVCKLDSNKIYSERIGNNKIGLVPDYTVHKGTKTE